MCLQKVHSNASTDSALNACGVTVDKNLGAPRVGFQIFRCMLYPTEKSQ